MSVTSPPASRAAAAATRINFLFRASVRVVPAKARILGLPVMAAILARIADSRDLYLDPRRGSRPGRAVDLRPLPQHSCHGADRERRARPSAAGWESRTRPI